MIKAIIFDFFGVLNKEMSPNLELISYVKTTLKPKYKLGILSNATDESMYEIIDQNELKKIFNSIIISYQAGVAKPDAAIYEKALDNLCVQAAETVFIDDIERFCDAARELGINPILYRNFPQMKKELEELLAAVPDN